MSTKRTKLVNFKISEEEYEMLTAIAKHEGLTFSDWIRQSIRKTYRRIFGSPKAS